MPYASKKGKCNIIYILSSFLLECNLSCKAWDNTEYDNLVCWVKSCSMSIMALQEGDMMSLKVPLCWRDLTPVSCSLLWVDEGTRCPGFASAHCLCRATRHWPAAACWPWTEHEHSVHLGLWCCAAKRGGAIPSPFPCTLLSWHTG